MRGLIGLISGILLAQSVGAAEPRTELLRLVPDETAICVVVQGLRERSRIIEASPFAEWIGSNFKSTLGGAPELQKLKDAEGVFTTFLGVSINDLKDEILGDVVVLCYQPGVPGKPETEQGAVMLKARDPAKLSQLIGKLNALQKSSGEVRSIDSRTYREQEYFKRAKNDTGGEYYLLDDGLFVFAAQESAIHAVIDRRLHVANEKISAKGRVNESLARLGLTNVFMTCWVNPRKLDADVQSHAKAAVDPDERALRQQFLQVWSSLDEIAIYLNAEKDLELGLSATYRAPTMPPELRKVLNSSPKSSTLWSVVPDDAMFAIGGRVTGQDLLEMVQFFMPPSERETVRQDVEKTIGSVIGKDKLPELLKGIGPDWAAWISPPRSNNWVPAMTTVVRIDETTPRVAQSLSKAISFYTQFLQVQYNRTHEDQIESNTTRTESADVIAFTNSVLFPAGFEPSYTVTNGYFILAGTTALVANFRSPMPGTATNDRVPFLRISAVAIRDYLEKYGTDLAQWLAERQGRPQAEIQKDFQSVRDALIVVDRCELSVQGKDNQMNVTFRIKFVKPLSK